MECRHTPSCPEAGASDATAAAIVADHCEQGWFLLCNGVIIFDDGGCVTCAVRPRTPAA